MELNIPGIQENFKNSLVSSLVYPPFLQFALAGNISYHYSGRDSYISLGVGTQITLEPVWIELEAKCRDLADSNGSRINFLTLQYSILLGTTVDKIFDYFAIVSMNSPEISGSGTPNVLDPTKYTPNEKYTLSYGIGIQFLFYGIPNW